jgi:hypothetical protein
MDLFREDSHFTKEGLQAIVVGTLSELESLEAVEHLSFCDKCLTKYTALLTDDVLLEPVSSVCQPVLQRIKKRGQHIMFNRFRTIAAAACLVAVVWVVGSFVLPGMPTATTPQQSNTTQSQEGTSWIQQLGQATQNFVDATDHFFGNIFSSNDTQPPPSVAQAQQRNEQNRQREEVFKQNNNTNQRNHGKNDPVTPSDASSQADKQEFL